MLHIHWKPLIRFFADRWPLSVNEYQLMPLPDDSNGHCVWCLPDRAPHHAKNSLLKTTSIVFLCLVVAILASLGVVHITIVILGHGGYASAGSATRSQTVSSTGRARLGADITQDVVPIPCHSHNDYWRSNPLFDAISAGCTSVEADIWLKPDATEIYVCHSKSALSEGRTLRALYLDPIAQLLSETAPNDNASHSPLGIFPTASKQTLVLLLDFKHGGESMLRQVQKQIEPLRNSHSLSFSNGTNFIARPVTIVATGNVPYDAVTQTNSHRDIFFDAPLDDLHSSTTERTSRSVMSHGSTYASRDPIPQASTWDANNSYYASTSFRRTFGHPWVGRLSSSQMDLLRDQIREAHLKGLQVRYWDTPAWPISLRNDIWRVLLEEGSDVLNVDDLRAAAFLDWRSVQHDWFNG